MLIAKETPAVGPASPREPFTIRRTGRRPGRATAIRGACFGPASRAVKVPDAAPKNMGADGEPVENPLDRMQAIHQALGAGGSYVLGVHTEAGPRLVPAPGGVIPTVGDRTPKKGHLADVIDGSRSS